MFAVQLHKLGFYQLRLIADPGNAEYLSGASYSFKAQASDFICCQALVAERDKLKEDFAHNHNNHTIS